MPIPHLCTFMDERVPHTTEAEPRLLRLALAASILFHPAVIPTLAFATLIFGNYVPIGLPVRIEGWLLSFLSLITLFLPVALLSVAHYFGLLTDWQLRPRADRQFALWLIVGLYGASTYMLSTIPSMPAVVLTLMVGLSVLALVTALINLFYRISGHALAVAAFVGYWGGLAYQSGDIALVWPFTATILAAGVVAWARLMLQAHTVGQVVWGLVVGSVAGSIVAYWA